MNNDIRISIKGVTVGDEDFGTLCICAIRYCIGRRSYMPSLIQGYIRPLLPYLTNKTLAVMRNDIETANGMSLMPEIYPWPWGDDNIDKPGWMAFLADIEAELENRK